jgi:hypothetical protein
MRHDKNDSEFTLLEARDLLSEWQKNRTLLECELRADLTSVHLVVLIERLDGSVLHLSGVLATTGVLIPESTIELTINGGEYCYYPVPHPSIELPAEERRAELTLMLRNGISVRFWPRTILQ